MEKLFQELVIYIINISLWNWEHKLRAFKKKHIVSKLYPIRCNHGRTNEMYCDCGANIQILSIASKTEDSKKYKIIY